MGCHGLVPWSFHACGYTRIFRNPLDAMGLSHGGAHALCYLALERESPRHKAVASGTLGQCEAVATSIKLHGTSPWYLFSHQLSISPFVQILRNFWKTITPQFRPSRHPDKSPDRVIAS